MIRWFVLGGMVEFILIVGFGFAVRTEWDTLGKTVIAALAILALGAVFFLAAKHHRFARLALLAVCLGAAASILSQLVGFTVFPGFVKDLTFLSVEQLTNTFVLFCIATSFLLFVMAVAVLLRHLLSAEKNQLV
jgi:hypothetical protein